MEKLTVCILAYNAEQYIRDTLESLERQQGQYHYLLIVDGSIDNTLAICEEFALYTKHPINIKVFETNHGTAFCRQWALENIVTDYMMFFDSDDIAMPGLVKELYSALQADKKCVAVSCQASYIDANGKKLPGGLFFKMSDANAFVKRASEGKLIFMLPATMFRREYAIKAGGYRQASFPDGTLRYQDFSEDLDIWSRMSDFYIDGMYMVTLPKVLYYYRKRTDSLSAAKSTQFAMSLKIKFIKLNLKLRRAGIEEMTFNEFLSNRTVSEKFRDKRQFYSEYFYRKAAFAFAKHQYFKIALNLLVSIVLNPKYFIQKIRANIVGK